MKSDGRSDSGVHEKVRANMDRIPIGIPEPLIVGRGIDDVAILSLSLASKPEAADRWSDNALHHLASSYGWQHNRINDLAQ
jgi:hypothetical protein